MTSTKLVILFWLIGAAWCDADEIEVHGFASQGFLLSAHNDHYADTQDGTFEFNEFGVNVASDPTDQLHLALQLLSRDLGEFGNNAVRLDWAYATYRWKDWLAISSGAMKMKWGLYNDTRDLDFLRTWIFLPPSLYIEREREAYTNNFGVMLTGNLLSKRRGAFEYGLFYGELHFDENSGIFGLRTRHLFNHIRADVTDIIGGGLDWDTPLPNLRLNVGGSTYRSNFHAVTSNDPLWTERNIPAGMPYSLSNRGSVVTASVEYVRDALTLAAEYRQQRAQSDSDAVAEGYYASAAYRLTEWLECGAYYSVLYPNKGDKSGNSFRDNGQPAFFAWQKEWVMTTRVDLTEAWMLKLEGHLINGAADLAAYDPNPEEIDKHSFLFAVKTTFNF